MQLIQFITSYGESKLGKDLAIPKKMIKDWLSHSRTPDSNRAIQLIELSEGLINDTSIMEHCRLVNNKKG